MSRLFLFAIGGTGSRVVKSLTMLMASGVVLKGIDDVVPIIIDPDSSNGDLTRTVDILKEYRKNVESKNNPFKRIILLSKTVHYFTLIKKIPLGKNLYVHIEPEDIINYENIEMNEMLGPGGTQKSILGPGGERRMLGPGGTQKPTLGPGGTQQQQQFDFSKSNLILMVGGQILLLVFLLIIVFFGTAPLSFPAAAVRNMVSSRNNSK